MGTAERREREREHLRTAILEAARDILSERGLDALSMREIARRIEYSPATIYLYFRDKDELIREVVFAGFHLLGETVRGEIRALGAEASAAAVYAATGRAYARFALENTAYFRVMFELPKAASLECPEPCEVDPSDEASFAFVLAAAQRASEEGQLEMGDIERGVLIGWGLIHGLVSLYLAGHLAESVRTQEEFFELLDAAMAALYAKKAPAGAGADTGEAAVA